MSDDRAPRLERLLEQTARKVSGGALHPLEVLQRIEEEFKANVRDGVAPNDIRVAFHLADFARYGPALDRLRREIASRLDGIEHRSGLRRMGDRRVGFERSEEVTEGRVSVRTLFADARHRDQAPVPGVTRRLRRQRSAVLVLGDGTRVRVTHTPFTIGRGPGNDLVLASMAISRRHAELFATEAGFEIRDLGSRNGLVVDGERRDPVRLTAGVVVALGDVELRLEEAP